MILRDDGTTKEKDCIMGNIEAGVAELEAMVL